MALFHQKNFKRSWMQHITDTARDTIQSSIVRSMAKAIYSTTNIGHFGLAFDYYTHFTSPIRRYPDVMVHRLLQMVIDGAKVTQKTMQNSNECVSIHQIVKKMHKLLNGIQLNINKLNTCLLVLVRNLPVLLQDLENSEYSLLKQNQNQKE
jgi:exoribonuclease R